MEINTPKINLNKIKAKRIECSLSQEDLANILNISIPTYSRKESGHVAFSLIEAKILANLYKTKIEDIFFAPAITIT